MHSLSKLAPSNIFSNPCSQITKSQLQVDAHQSSFISQVSDTKIFISMAVGSTAFSLGRSLVTGLLSGVMRRCVLQGAWAAGVLAEVAGFRATNQILNPQAGESWHQALGFANTTSDFVIMKGLMSLFGNSNFFVRQTALATGLVFNQNIGESLGLRREEIKSFGEQMTSALVIGIALEIGSQASHLFTGNALQRLNRNIDFGVEVNRALSGMETLTARNRLERMGAERTRDLPEYIVKVLEVVEQIRVRDPSLQAKLNRDMNLLRDVMSVSLSRLSGEGRGERELIESYFRDHFEPTHLIRRISKTYLKDPHSIEMENLLYLARSNIKARRGVHGLNLFPFLITEEGSAIPKGLRDLYNFFEVGHPQAIQALSDLSSMAQQDAINGDRGAMFFLSDMALSYRPAYLALGKAAIAQNFALKLFRMRNSWRVIEQEPAWVEELVALDPVARETLPAPRYRSEIIDRNSQRFDPRTLAQEPGIDDTQFPRGTVREITDYFMDHSRDRSNLGDILIDESFDDLRAAFKRIPGTRIFYVSWQGSKIPDGLRILGDDVVWMQHGIVQAEVPIIDYASRDELRAPIGGNMNIGIQTKGIGTYSRISEFAGKYGYDHSVYIFIRPKRVEQENGWN